MIRRGIEGRHFSSDGLSRAGYWWLAGGCLVLWWPAPFPVAALAGVLLAALLGVMGRRAAAAWWLAGLLCSEWAVQQQLRQRWPVERGEQRVVALVAVDSVPVPRGVGREFDADVQVLTPTLPAVRLRARITAASARFRPQAGERWQLLLRLRPPRAVLNPGAPDQERYLFRERVHALGAVIDSPLNRRVGAARPGLLALRESIAQRVRAQVADRDAAALIAALAVGVTGGMSREQWRVFSATGTTHLVAISGLHVTLFAWIAAALTRRVWGRVGSTRGGERESWAAGAAIVAAGVYALLAGFSVPTQRTFAMLCVWWLARRSGRDAGGLEVVSLALLAVLLLDPFAPLAAGFWLSFGAIGVLLMTGSFEHGVPTVVQTAVPAGAQAAPRASRLASWSARLRSAVLTQGRVTLALAPATVALFASIPLIGLAANLIAIPFFSLLLVPLVLAGLALSPWWPAVAGLAWQAAEQSYRLAWPLFEALADLPWASWHTAPALPALLAATLAVPAWLWPGPWSLRAAATLAFLPLLANDVEALPEASFTATVLDAGDGVAVLVRTARHALLYDTGEVYGSGGTRATRLVQPAVTASGVRRIDLLVVSEASGVRAAGAGALLSSADVGAARVGGRWPGAPPGVQDCRQPRAWQWDGVELQLFPGQRAGLPETGRGASCILRIHAAGGTLLLPARIDAREAAELAAGRTALRADVLLAPRRGSPAAVLPAFAARVEPRYVIVASREFGAARRAALALLWHVPEAAILATAHSGALQVRAGGGRPLEVRAVLETGPHWRWRVPRG
jgi:competence protein ComEC